MRFAPSITRTEAAAAVLLVAVFVQTLYVITSTSPVLDEQFYPGVGKYTATTGDFSPFAYRFHPPLAYYINSLFLYADANPVWSMQPFDMANVAGAYGLDNLLLLTRLPIALTSLVLGFFVFIWARRLYGNKAALFSLALFSFEPTIIAHSAVATTDMVAATFVFVSMYFLWRFHDNRTKLNMAVSASLLGLALLTKFTALALLPITLLVFLLKFRPIRKNAKFVVLYYLLAFVIVWGFYGFQVSTINDTVHSTGKSQEFIGSAFGAGEREFINKAMDIPLPAAQYFTAFGYSVYHSYVGHGAYMFGEYSIHGWIHYYVLAFAVKATIPLIAFILALAIFAAAGKARLDANREIFLLLPMFVLFAALSAMKLNIGLRHLLPVYPFLFVMLGKLAGVKFPKMKGKIYNCALLVLIAWAAAEAMFILPYNMSYFNEFAGGPKNGYTYLSDTDVDWGQWLKYVSAYAADRNITGMYLTQPLPDAFTKYYVANYTKPPCEPRNGVYFVSVSSLILYDNPGAGGKGCIQWLRNYTHQDMIGYSVLVYSVTDAA